MTILELASQHGLAPRWKASTAGGEYYSACPLCGGKDRFYIQPYKQMNRCLGYYCCRQCGTRGDTIKFACDFLRYTFRDAIQMLNITMPEKIAVFFKACSSNLTILKEPTHQWLLQATSYAQQANAILLSNKEMIAYLESRGISLDTINKHKIGWSSNNHFFSRKEWGLEEQVKPDGSLCKLWIPRGIVVPSCLSNGQVVRLKVRRHGWKVGDERPKYVAISGSMNGLSCIGDHNKQNVVVVESELDAYAINHAAGDFVLAIAVGSNIKNPDNVSDDLAKKVRHLLICHDNDEAGKKMLLKWRNLYPHAKSYSTPIGKDIGEAIQNGLNIRDWLLQGVRNSDC